MTADDARSNVKAWRNNQAQIASLEIEMNEKLKRLFDYFFVRIEHESMGGLNQYNFHTREIENMYGKFDHSKIQKLFLQLGFSVNRDWDSYGSDWCWFIGW